MGLTEKIKGIQHNHLLLMILCCVIPIAMLGILFAVGFNAAYLALGILLLFPLMHVFLMKGMHKHHEHEGSEGK